MDEADNVQRIAGTNGRALQDCTGRLRTVDDKGHVRLGWTDKAANQRCIGTSISGNATPLALWNPEGMAGCCMSHTLALQAGLAADRGYFLALEDDCSTDVPLLASQILKAAVDGMPEGWTVLQLGADSAGPAALSRRSCHRNITVEDFVGALPKRRQSKS